LVTQSLKGLRVASPLDEFATYEVTLTDLAKRTALSFSDTLHTAAAAAVGPGLVAALATEPRAVRDLAAIRW